MQTSMITKKNPEERWRLQKAKLKLKFPHLDDDDFQYDYGRKEVMMTQLQAKLGKSRKELNVLLAGL
jgi:hypothetical protein